MQSGGHWHDGVDWSLVAQHLALAIITIVSALIAQRSARRP